LRPVGGGKAVEPVGLNRQVASAQQDDRRQPGPGAADIRVESLEREPQASPDGADRHPQHGCDLGVGSALQVRERDHAALLGTELGHATANRLPIERRRQCLPLASGGVAGSEIVRQQLLGMALTPQAAAWIDTKYVMSVGQPGAHGVQPPLVAGLRRLGSVRPLVLESSHEPSTVIPTPSKDRLIDLEEPTPGPDKRAPVSAGLLTTTWPAGRVC
jgi:hypothetical protein